MSGRRTSGSSRPSLGVQVLAVFFLHFLGKLQIEKCLGEHLEVPDIRGLLRSLSGVGQKVTRRVILSHFRVIWVTCKSLFESLSGQPRKVTSESL